MSGYELDLDECSRCLAPHPAVAFARLQRPVVREGEVIYTHWATCPATGEPLLAKISPFSVDDWL